MNEIIWKFCALQWTETPWEMLSSFCPSIITFVHFWLAEKSPQFFELSLNVRVTGPEGESPTKDTAQKFWMFMFHCAHKKNNYRMRPVFSEWFGVQTCYLQGESEWRSSKKSLLRHISHWSVELLQNIQRSCVNNVDIPHVLQRINKRTTVHGLGNLVPVDSRNG